MGIGTGDLEYILGTGMWVSRSGLENGIRDLGLGVRDWGLECGLGLRIEDSVWG